MSTYYDILTAIQANVAAVVPNTVLRRKLFRLQSDVLPIVYVVPQMPPGERISGQQWQREVWYEYPVLIVYVQAGAENLTTGLPQYLQVRQDIRQVLYTTLLNGDAEVFDTTFSPEEAVKFAEFLGTDYDVSGWLMRYKVNENRNS